jgi:hypothetical protein
VTRQPRRPLCRRLPRPKSASRHQPSAVRVTGVMRSASALHSPRPRRSHRTRMQKALILRVHRQLPCARSSQPSAIGNAQVGTPTCRPRTDGGSSVWQAFEAGYDRNVAGSVTRCRTLLTGLGRDPALQIVRQFDRPCMATRPEPLAIHMRTREGVTGSPRSSPLCCQARCGGLLLRRDCGRVLASVKVGPARARRGAGPDGAPPGRRLRSGWLGAYQEQAEM